MTTSTLHGLSEALADMVAAAGGSVVAVHARRARWSGFVWRPGLVVNADSAVVNVALPRIAGELGVAPAQSVWIVISNHHRPASGAMLVQHGWTAVIGPGVANDKACGVIFRQPRGAVVREDSRVLPACSAGRGRPR